MRTSDFLIRPKGEFAAKSKASHPCSLRSAFQHDVDHRRYASALLIPWLSATFFILRSTRVAYWAS